MRNDTVTSKPTHLRPSFLRHNDRIASWHGERRQREGTPARRSRQDKISTVPPSNGTTRRSSHLVFYRSARKLQVNAPIAPYEGALSITCRSKCREANAHKRPPIDPCLLRKLLFYMKRRFGSARVRRGPPPAPPRPRALPTVRCWGAPRATSGSQGRAVPGPRGPVSPTYGPGDGRPPALTLAWKRFAPGTPPPQVFAQAPVPRYPGVLQVSADPTRRPGPFPPRGCRGPSFFSFLRCRPLPRVPRRPPTPRRPSPPPHNPTAGPIAPSPQDRRRSRRWRPVFLEERAPSRYGEAARSPPACPVVVVRSSGSAGRGS